MQTALISTEEILTSQVKLSSDWLSITIYISFTFIHYHSKLRQPKYRRHPLYRKPTYGKWTVDYGNRDYRPVPKQIRLLNC